MNNGRASYGAAVVHIGNGIKVVAYETNECFRK
jgi:hypothetical protein